MPNVSVIIPTYNRADYLDEAIKSVLNQTFQDFEIIIIDDGSTDNTLQLVKEYINGHPDKIRYFYQENKGQGSARNIGLREAGAEYIAFLDSDDEALPRRLELEVDVLENNPQIGLVYSDVYIRSENKLRRLNRLNNGTMSKEDALNNLLLNGCFIINSTVLFREDISRDLYQNEKLRTGEDYLFFLEMALRCSFFGIKEPLALLRRGHDSLVSNKFDMFDDRVNVIKEFYRHNKIEDVDYNTAVSLCYLNNARDILYSDEIRRKISSYFKNLNKSFRSKNMNLYLYKHLIGELLLKGNVSRLWQ